MDNKSPDYKADIVIIGGGGAGLVAAVSAAEKGAKNIIVLEARDTFGGNAVYAISMSNIGKPTLNKKTTETLRDKLFLNAMEFTHWRSNARVVRAPGGQNGRYTGVVGGQRSKIRNTH